MRYTGDADKDVCAITCVPVKELSRPVGFDAAHAFECEAIVEWITKHRRTNPMTGLPLPPNTAVARLLHPLIIVDDASHAARVPETQLLLDRAGWTTTAGADKVVCCC
jgi:hypothetical protein